jgi:hypothetical protein
MKAFRSLTMFLIPGLAAAQLSLKIATEHPIIAVDEDFEVTATVSNVAGRQLWIDFGDYEDDYKIDLRDTSGNKVAESAYTRRLRNSIKIGGTRLIQFPPDGVRSEKIDLAKFFDIPGPGTYTVEFSRLDMHSNVLIFTVLPGSAHAGGPVTRQVSPAIVLASSGTAGGHFSLAIDVDRANVVAGKEIPVYTLLTNLSDGNVNIPVPHWVGSSAGIDVRDGEGNAVGETELSQFRKKVRAEQGETVHRRTMTGKMQLQSSFDIAQCANLTAPGTYFVQLYWKVPDDLGGGEVRSNTLQITVRPKGSR